MCRNQLGWSPVWILYVFPNICVLLNYYWTALKATAALHCCFTEINELLGSTMYCVFASGISNDIQVNVTSIRTWTMQGLRCLRELFVSLPQSSVIQQQAYLLNSSLGRLAKSEMTEEWAICMDSHSEWIRTEPSPSVFRGAACERASSVLDHSSVCLCFSEVEVKE